MGDFQGVVGTPRSWLGLVIATYWTTLPTEFYSSPISKCEFGATRRTQIWSEIRWRWPKKFPYNCLGTFRTQCCALNLFIRYARLRVYSFADARLQIGKKQNWTQNYSMHALLFFRCQNCDNVLDNDSLQLCHKRCQLIAEDDLFVTLNSLKRWLVKRQFYAI